MTLPPTTATSISLDAISYSSTVSMSWGAVADATGYQVQERANGGGFVQVYDGTATSTAQAGRGPAQWDYQVRGCNAAGCGPWSAVAGVRVIGPPGAPGINVPATAGLGVAYTASASEVADATGYELDESSDGANWGRVSQERSFSTSKGAGGTYFYRARGCSPAGCGANSAVGQIAISSAPPVPNGVRISIRTPMQCQVTWGASPGATYYEVKAGRITHTASGISWETDSGCSGGYAVRACNAQACSAWSAQVN